MHCSVVAYRQFNAADTEEEILVLLFVNISSRVSYCYGTSPAITLNKSSLIQSQSAEMQNA